MNTSICVFIKIIFFKKGDRNCGKTSLLSKLKNKDLHKDAKGLAIDYTYLEVKEDDGMVL